MDITVTCTAERLVNSLASEIIQETSLRLGNGSKTSRSVSPQVSEHYSTNGIGEYSIGYCLD